MLNASGAIKQMPNNIKQIENKNQFTRELKKRCYYSIEEYLNEEFSNTGC
jgi:hypothetical protein